MAYLKIEVCCKHRCLWEGGVSQNGTWHLFDVFVYNRLKGEFVQPQILWLLINMMGHYYAAQKI